MTPVSRIGDGAHHAALLDQAAFARVARLAQTAAGLSIPDSKRTMVQSRLTRRLKATGIPDFSTYLDLVESRDGDAEREHMVSALTTNVSHFFREDHHFETLREQVIPGLLARARLGGKIRIWSAGCSTGQEPYTIAMTLLEASSTVEQLDVRILATDIDAKVLAAAKLGQYDERQVQPIPPALLSKYFSRDRSGQETRFEAGDRLRSLIRFRQLNLMAPWPMKGFFDAIFCRNVVIYFSDQTQSTLWPRFHEKLVPGGWFFLGHSERMQDARANGFEMVGVTTYRRQSVGDPSISH